MMRKTAQKFAFNVPCFGHFSLVPLRFLITFLNFLIKQLASVRNGEMRITEGFLFSIYNKEERNWYHVEWKIDKFKACRVRVVWGVGPTAHTSWNGMDLCKWFQNSFWWALLRDNESYVRKAEGNENSEELRDFSQIREINLQLNVSIQTQQLGNQNVSV